MTTHQFLISRELGGAALVALQLSAELGRHAHSPLIWLPGRGPASEEASRRGLQVRTYASAPIFNQHRAVAAAGNLGMLWSLRRLGRGLAHVHSPHLYGAMAPALRSSGLSRVVHVHLAEEPSGLRWTLRRPPELIITCARSLVELVREALPERHRRAQWIEAVPNPVDTERFSPAADKDVAKRRVGAPAGVPLALMLANLAPHKGQETAIRAVAELSRREILWVCWLAGVERGGEGVYTAHLRALIEGLGLRDRVQLLGQRGDAPDLLRAADAFLLPSTREGLPLSILEAQVSGVPVLAAPIAGVPEVVRDRQTGFLIPADDVRGYADCLATLIENPGLTAQLAGRAHARVLSESSLVAYSERIDVLYQELAKRRFSRFKYENIRYNKY